MGSGWHGAHYTAETVRFGRAARRARVVRGPSNRTRYGLGCESCAGMLSTGLQQACRRHAHVRVLGFDRGGRSSRHRRGAALLGSLRSPWFLHHCSQGVGDGAIRGRFLVLESGRRRPDGPRRGRARSGNPKSLRPGIRTALRSGGRSTRNGRQRGHTDPYRPSRPSSCPSRPVQLTAAAGTATGSSGP